MTSRNSLNPQDPITASNNLHLNISSFDEFSSQIDDDCSSLSFENFNDPPCFIEPDTSSVNLNNPLIFNHDDVPEVPYLDLPDDIPTPVNDSVTSASADNHTLINNSNMPTQTETESKKRKLSTLDGEDEPHPKKTKKNSNMVENAIAITSRAQRFKNYRQSPPQSLLQQTLIKQFHKGLASKLEQIVQRDNTHTNTNSNSSQQAQRLETFQQDLLQLSQIQQLREQLESGLQQVPQQDNSVSNSNNSATSLPLYQFESKANSFNITDITARAIACSITMFAPPMHPSNTGESILINPNINLANNGPVIR